MCTRLEALPCRKPWGSGAFVSERVNVESSLISMPELRAGDLAWLTGGLPETARESLWYVLIWPPLKLKTFGDLR